MGYSYLFAGKTERKKISSRRIKYGKNHFKNNSCNLCNCLPTGRFAQIRVIKKYVFYG
jgi:hypothetical protein